MFTGLIAELGTVEAVTIRDGGVELVVRSTKVARAAKAGDSIAVNGACLSVTNAVSDGLAFDVVPETLRRTNLGELRKGDRVNLEPSLRLGAALDGHLVYGHIDATARIESKETEGPGWWIWLSVPAGLDGLIVEKGFVALDGVSLTVAAKSPERASFAVALIPETLARTTFGLKGAGDELNLEADPIARYVAHALRERLGHGS